MNLQARYVLKLGKCKDHAKPECMKGFQTALNLGCLGSIGVLPWTLQVPILGFGGIYPISNISYIYIYI